MRPIVNEGPADTSLQRVQGDVYCYYQSPDKKTLLGPYAACLDEKLDLFARVQEKGRYRFMTIDRLGKTINEIYVENNHVDDVEHGHYRFIDHGKMGLFSVHTGQAAVRPELDWVSPVTEKGQAIACIDCQKSWDGDHVYHHGGRWGVIDASSSWVVEPTYDAITHSDPEFVFLKNRQKCEVSHNVPELFEPVLNSCFGEATVSQATAQR